MADSDVLDPKPQNSESDAVPPSPLAANPNSNQALLPTLTPPPPHQQVSGGLAFAPPAMPSFRPLPQFSPKLSYQNPSVQPHGVSFAPAMFPGFVSRSTAVPVAVPPMMPYQIPPVQPAIPPLRPYTPMPNGYAAVPVARQWTVPPAGMLRYPPPYGTMVRPVYPPRPPGAVNVLPVPRPPRAVNVLPVPRPPVAGVPAVPPIIPPVVWPVVAPSVTPVEKPQITVYVGKTAPTVENDFMLSLLQKQRERPEAPDRRHDRRSRERDRDRELTREKEREIERYKREAERERIRIEREHRRRVEEVERQYEAYLKEWEYREREKEKERQYEKDKEKERERKRRMEILYDEEDEDDDSRKRWCRSVLEEMRKKRFPFREGDLADRQKEEEEIAEAKKRAEEDQQQKQQRDVLTLLSDHVVNGGEKVTGTEEIANEAKFFVTEQDIVADYNHEGNIAMGSVAETDIRLSGNAPAKKLGFGLIGSGQRTTVPSVFHEEEEEDAHKDKKMRPLVPIDYSTEELQAVQPTASGPTPPNLAAAAEFAKRVSSANFKEEKLDGERDRSRRMNEKSNHRDRDRGDEDDTHIRDKNKEKIPDRDRDRDRGLDKLKTSDNKRLLDAKQLIDMIPKTKKELLSYEINWAVYDKHQLHERMRPWISKKIKELLGEEENTLIDYIVSSIQEHVKASQMLERLQIILDEEAEMFVLKMWRMLIFEIKKVETGFALRSK